MENTNSDDFNMVSKKLLLFGIAGFIFIILTGLVIRMLMNSL